VTQQCLLVHGVFLAEKAAMLVDTWSRGVSVYKWKS